MPQPLIHINSRKIATRVCTIFVVVLSLVWAFLLVRWYIGNTLAEYLNPEINDAQLARLPVSLAPDDPLTHWRLADFTEKKLPIDQIESAVREYEIAVSLSPYDYRYWMAFGRALEQASDIDRAERALRRAVELAPAYSYPRWYLGNLLLRNGQYDEAFAELRLASEADPELRSQLFNLAWEVFREDIPKLQAAVGRTAAARAHFSQYLIERGRVDDGLSLWSTLLEDERHANLPTADAIIASLVNNRNFHRAASVWNGVSPTSQYQVAIGKILDPGFELGGSHTSGSPFGWQVKSHHQAQIAVDPNQPRNGSRSLRIVFQLRSDLTTFSISQLVPVQPNTQYTIRAFVKTRELASAATPILTISDATNSSSLANSAPAPTGNNDWQPITLTFKTAANTEAISLTLQRSSCGENEVCPMFGTIWYDDFDLKAGN